MNIGEEEEVIEVPIPLMPGQTPEREVVPEQTPAPELVPAGAPAEGDK